MKKLFLIVLVLTCAQNVFAAKPSKRPPMTPEQKAALREARQRQTGGFLTVPGHGHFAVLSSSEFVSPSVIQDALKSLESFVQGLKIDIATAPFSLREAKATREANGAGAAVFLTENIQLPLSLIALEEGWGVINVALLRDDDQSKFEKRVRKEIIRVASVVFSGARSEYSGSPLQHVRSVDDLDKTIGEVFTIDSLMAISKNLPDIDIVPDTMITYKAACEKGIAPPPTNDYQKVIWEQIKADKERGPTRPIEIPPPGKK